MGVGPNAYALYWAMNSYSNNQLLDGYIADLQIRAVASVRLIPAEKVDEAIADLVAVGAWEPQDTGHYHIHDYLDYNDSKEVVLARRAEITEARQMAGRQGGLRSGAVRREKAEATKQNRSKTEAIASDFASGLLEANGSKREANAKQNEAPDPVPDPLRPLSTNVDNGASHDAPVSFDTSLYDKYVARWKAEPANKRTGALRDLLVEIFGQRLDHDQTGHLVAVARDFGAGEVIKAALANVALWNGVDDPVKYLNAILRDKKARSNGRANGRAVDHSEQANDLDTLHRDVDEMIRRRRAETTYPPR